MVLRGDIVTPMEVISHGIISMTGNKISEVGPSFSGPADSILDTDSFIFPGLIDLHNHLTWNVFKRWPHKKEPKAGQENKHETKYFNNRYEWQQEKSYKDSLVNPHNAIIGDRQLACETEIYGEIKAIIGGATSVVGGLTSSIKYGYDNKCIEGLARNLDDFADFDDSVLHQEKVQYEVFPFEMNITDAVQAQRSLETGKKFIVHAGEGKREDAASLREFNMLAKHWYDYKNDGYLRAGVIVIHGTAFGSDEFKKMADHGVGLVWSPRSNVELYNETTDIQAAKDAGVKIAIAPDWSPSGSNGMIEELQYAAKWNSENQSPFKDEEMVKAATTVPAVLAGSGDRIGALSVGLYADMVLIKKHPGDSPSAYQALLHAAPDDVRLVVIGGTPIYGDKSLMEKLLPGRVLEQIRVCGADKALYIEPKMDIPETQLTFAKISSDLQSKLTQFNTSLADVTSCEKIDK